MFDAVSLHGYWSTAGLTRWNALRWRLFAPPGVPIIVSEAGRDRVRDGPNGTYLPSEHGENFGWQAQGLTGDEFLAELRAYDAELRADGVYGVVFTTSADDEWNRKGFSVDELAHRCFFTNLGPHDLEGRSPDALRWAERASIVKSVDQTAAIRRAPRGAITVYRRRYTPAEQDAMLERGDADRLVGGILEGLDGFRADRLYVELLNEIGKGRRDQYVRLARAAVPRLRAAGVLVAGPSWATGDFEAEDWRAFTEGAMAAGNDGPRTRTIGVVVHSTRSGVDRSLEEEAEKTAAWMREGAPNPSCHKVISPTRAIEVVPKPLAAWHARNPLNGTHLGYELAQPFPGTPYHPGQYKLLARELVEDARAYGFPLVHVASGNTTPGIIGHEETANGRADGKSDPGDLFSWDLLMREIAALTKKPFNIAAERDLIWAMASNLEANGYVWYGQGLKALTAKDKGEK